MSRRLNLPDSASVATPSGDGRLFAPSAARNAEAIATLVATHAPETGRALVLGGIVAAGHDPDAIFSGAGHAPPPLDPAAFCMVLMTTKASRRWLRSKSDNVSGGRKLSGALPSLMSLD